ncbi:MAG: helix-turn-helix domain-containing protein [Bacteroidota bacterium]
MKKTEERDLTSERLRLKKKLLPIVDTMEILSGRWRVVIMTTLYLGGPLRFNEIRRMIPKITGRMLSKDLKFLEDHEIVSRKTIVTMSPIAVEYELTAHGKTLDPVFRAINDWGSKHRERIMNK